MKSKVLGSWTMASGNAVEVVATVSGGDLPRVLSIRPIWSWTPAPGDVKEYQRRVRPQLGRLLVPYHGSVTIM